MKEFNEIIEKIGEKEDFFFVQIGSNDGVMADPLYKYIKKYDWSGIMVEPVPYLYERLVKNHKGRDNLTFRNVAVSNEGGLMKFYYFKDHIPEINWTLGLGSFNKDVIMSHRTKISNFDKYIANKDIETITFDSLVDGVAHIDLLQIDTEGYDYEIIKSIDFDKHQPSLILFENKFLFGSGVRNGTSKKMRRKVYKYLHDRGYDKCVSNKSDTLVIHKDLKI